MAASDNSKGDCDACLSCESQSVCGACRVGPRCSSNPHPPTQHLLALLPGAALSTALWKHSHVCGSPQAPQLRGPSTGTRHPHSPASAGLLARQVRAAAQTQTLACHSPRQPLSPGVSQPCPGHLCAEGLAPQTPGGALHQATPGPLPRPGLRAQVSCLPLLAPPPALTSPPTPSCSCTPCLPLPCPIHCTCWAGPPPASSRTVPQASCIIDLPNEALTNLLRWPLSA